MRTHAIAVGALTLLAFLPISALAKSSEADALKESFRKEGKQMDEYRGRREVDARRSLEQTLYGTLSLKEGSVLTLVVAGVSFRIDASSAVIVGKNNSPLALTDLQTNDVMTVKGEWTNGGILKAKHIRDHVIQARSDAFSGVVSSVATSSKTLVLTMSNKQTKTIYWNESTIVKKNGVVASTTDMLAGTKVHVQATWNREDGVITAKKITITIPTVNVHITGKITALSEKTLTVTAEDGKVYEVDTRSSALVFQRYGRMKFAHLQVGDSVDVWARGEEGSMHLKAYFVRNITRQSAKIHAIQMNQLNVTRELEIGDKLVLHPGSMYAWSSPTSSNPAVLVRMATGTAMVFEAKAEGTSEITATGNPVCAAATPACALPSVLFKAIVRVKS